MKYKIGDAFFGLTSDGDTVMTGTITKVFKPDNKYFVVWTYESPDWESRQAWYPESAVDEYIKNIPLKKRQPLEENLFTI